MAVHYLVNIVQFIGIWIPLVGCVCLLRKPYSRTSMYLLLANLGCLIINGSYFMLLQAKTDEGAFISLKMEYFGNVAFHLMFVMFLWSYLKFKRHKPIKIAFAVWCVLEVTAFFLLCAGDYSLIFENVDFRYNQALDLTFLHIKPGVWYLIRYCIICITLLCGMVYTTVRMFHMQIKSERINLAKLTGAQFVISVSLILMMLGNFSFDIMPIFTSAAVLSIIIGVYRGDFFGITELGQQWVFDQMEDAFIIVDEMYGYLDSNAYAKKIFLDLNYKHKNETVAGNLNDLFRNEEKVVQIQGKFYNKKITEIRDKGTLSGYSMLLVDVTEQHELTERVKEEKERADAANQAKSAFVSNVSHEIRTPMNAIVGLTQIMLRQNDLKKQDREYLLNIQNSGNALLAIINDLLDISKIESGKMELVDEEYNFMSMLNDLGLIILNRIGKKPVELLFDIDPDIPAKLYGDALRIRQIIINLMNNATKFTEEGYVCLTVKVGQIQQTDIELFISVRDTGQGIRSEDLDKLFGAFQQVDTKKNHHKEGTGLGLSISKQLVELMNGTIGVKSEYGSGSEFYFTIHQQIVEAQRAVRLSDGQQAAVAGSMRNAAAAQILRDLAQKYRLTYIEDIMSYNGSEQPLCYFTDNYDQQNEAERNKLAELNAVVCGLVNPMEENNFPPDIPTINKPLYSSNFCSFIENRQSTDVSEESETSPTEEKAQGTEFTAPEARILIVDDNEINLMITEELLDPLQMQIDTASNGQQALDMIQSSEYDLVFMDHIMPVMNGVEAVEALRKMDGSYYKDLPVIVLTGNTGKEQQEEYLRAGMSDYLSKPVDMADLYGKIRKWIPGKVKCPIKEQQL